MVDKRKEFEKMVTTELLNIEWDTLTDEEKDIWDEVITDRQPFSDICEELRELREQLDVLANKFPRHDHKEDKVLIRE